jgi:L-cystine transport system substrate-binding protein
MKSVIQWSNLFLLGLLALAVSGCQRNADNSKAGKPAVVQKIVVGTFAAIPSVSYLDAEGKLTGYDIEVSREINRRLPQYQFEFVSMEFPNLFLALDTKKIDFIAMHLEKNAARESKYLFNGESYDTSQTKVAIREGRTDIASIEDLKGKKVIVNTGGNPAFIIETFNRNNNDAVDVSYGASFDDVVKQIKAGRADATVIDVALAASLNEKVDARLALVGPNLAGGAGIFLALRKDGTVLAADIDQALKAMKADGTLSRLSRQWLKRDYH